MAITIWRNDRVEPAVAELMSRVIEAGFQVHRTLGPGFLESIYRRCLAHALAEAGLRVQQEVWIPVRFGSLTLERALRADIVVEDRVIIEVKAVEAFAPVHRAQVVSYLKASGLSAGALMNFNVPLFREGYDCIIHPRLLSVASDIADSRIRGSLPPDAEGREEDSPPI